MDPKSTPVTVFTGFLGAGKTTIIISLLSCLQKNYKVVLLKNEFGDIKGLYLPEKRDKKPKGN
jgi:G3E family GTPase